MQITQKEEKIMSLAGTWIMTNAWTGAPPYRFPATFGADGTITIPGGFFGTWTVLGGSSQVSLAIADFTGKTITSYCGNVAGGAMGGQMTGGSPGGGTSQGIWSAIQQAHAEASEGTFGLPVKVHSVRRPKAG